MKIYTENINTPVRPGTKEKLKELADDMGVTVSTLMRKAIEMVLKKKGK